MVWDALFWSLSQKETYIWWAAVFLVGLAALPLTFAFFRFLPDRGYAFSKPLGLVLMTYVLWIGATAHILPNSRVSLILILLGIGVASVVVVWRQRDELRAFIRDRFRYILLVEALFAVSLAVAVSLRSYVAEINWTEKPMDFAFLNAILRADSFPPEDPWLSGHTIPMYIFGHHMVAALTKLTGLSSGITFNLGVALVAALAAVGVFGLVYNLLVVRVRPGMAVLFGLVGVGLLLVLANMEGVFELFRRHQIGSTGFYGLLDINGLDGPIDCNQNPSNCGEWYPTEWFSPWWRATRMATNDDWREFPFFTFLMGDLHAHLLSIPLVLMAIGIALNVLRWPGTLAGSAWPGVAQFLRGAASGTRLPRSLSSATAVAAGLAASAWEGLAFWIAHPLRLLGIGVLVGALGFTDLWSLPVFFLLVVAMAAARNYLNEGRLNLAVVGQTVGFAVPLACLTVLLYLPFYLDFHPAGSGNGVLPLEVNGGKGPAEDIATRPHHLLYFWATILWPVASFFVVALGRWRDHKRTLGWALLPALVPFGLWVILVTAHEGPLGFVDEATARGGWWFTLAFLLAAVTVAALAFGQFLNATAREDQSQQSMLFALAAGGTAVLLLLGTELYWVNDPTGYRANSVFRLGYQAWILFSISGAFGLYYIVSRWKLGEMLAFTHRFAWVAITLVLVGAGLVYPIIASMNRTYGFRVNPELDGLAFVSRTEPADYEALRWLSENVKGTPVILEALGSDYLSFGRVSSRTGIPTVLGWPDHEWRWRGSWEPQGGQPSGQDGWCPSVRCIDVERAYKTTSVDEARAILDRYSVEYVYVGGMERDSYGEEGMAKFAELGKVVYQNPKVTIYRIGG
jgi:YYY domain-containing protein